ncbi:MAG: hypothetical protein ACMZ64_07640 [Oleiphilus sp.]
MRTECIEAVSRAIGRTLTQNEISNIEARLTESMRRLATQDRETWSRLSRSERFDAAAAEAGRVLIKEAQKKRQRLALKIAAHDRIEGFLSERQANDVDAFDSLARLVAFHADSKGNTLSIESTAKAIERDALRQMLDALEQGASKFKDDPKKWATHFFGLLENKEGTRALVKELFGEDSGIPGAKDGAKQFQAVAQKLKERFNRSGGDIGHLEDWGMPHHHSQMKVAKAGRKQWISDIKPFLNLKRYVNLDGSLMNEVQINGFLSEAWASIATNGTNKLEPGQYKGSGMRANRGHEGRKLHFNGADGYLDYQAKYGERSLYEVMTGHISGVSKDIAMVETFGPNPDFAFNYWKEKAFKEMTLKEPNKSGDLQKRIVKLENLYNLAAGHFLPSANDGLARVFDTMRSWMVASKLGSAVITSIGDEGTLYVSSKANNLPAMKVFLNEIKALNPANPMEKRLALRAGLSMNTMINSLNRFGQEGLGNTFSTKMATNVLRASGLNALTEARRRAFGVTMMSSIGQISKDFDSLSSLDPHDFKILRSKGITDTEWNVWRKASHEDWGDGNNTMLTPESIYRIPDKALEGMGDPIKLREQAATKLLGVVLEESDVAVVEPGVRERAIMLSNLQRGTWKGELTRSFFLFKSFPISMLTRHWMRGMDQTTAGGKAAYIASLVAATTVLGAAALEINEIVSGRDPVSLNPSAEGGTRNWIKAMMKGGSLGIYGDFLFSEASQYGQSPVASFMGPMIGTGEQVFNLTQGNIVQSLQGKETHAGAEFVRFAKSNIPGANLWYAKAALDHMIFHQLQEYFSPGYLSKMQNRKLREFGQQYWWEPENALPKRAPDLTRVVAD